MDKKLTDSEIVKALECCLETSGVNCGKCPYCDNCVTDENTSLMMTDVLDLINRQKAEIERLEKEYEKVYKQAEMDILANISDGSTSCHWCIDKTKAEAYKEFAEKLENRILSMLTTATLEEKEIICACIGINNNLLKELVGDSNETVL